MTVPLYKFWQSADMRTGIELEETFAAIPPTERKWWQRGYLWYRRNFWYILALGGTLLMALIIWDMANGCGCSGGQRGGALNLAGKGANKLALYKAGLKSGAAKAWEGAKSAPGAAAEGFRNASGTIYRWLFTIFIFFAVGVFIMPTVAMIILGLLTFYIARGSIRRTVAI